MEHALLAWRFVGWALEQGDAATRLAVANVFAHAEEWVGLGAGTALPGQAEAMRAHGYLPLSERRAIATAGLRDIIAPAARALLSSGGARRAISLAAEGWAGTGAPHDHRQIDLEIVASQENCLQAGPYAQAPGTYEQDRDERRNHPFFKCQPPQFDF